MHRLALAPLLLLAACATAPAADDSDPASSAVMISGAAPDWTAQLVMDNGATGVWTVEPRPVFPQYAADQLVALDDEGRCHVLISYSGKWTHRVRCEDGGWLGGVCHGDVDARVPGAELYVAGERGNVYQLTTFASGDLDCRLVAQLPGLEVHTLVCGDLDPRSPGAEVLVFTSPGRLYRLSPTGADGSFDLVLLEELPGRVRDALVMPTREDGATPIATANRSGRLELLTIGEQGADWETIHRERMGFGRLEFAATAPRGSVMYSTLDDGRVLRHERSAAGSWATETIFAGPQGPRGVAAGRFDEDPSVETVAVFGYSADVQLLSRREDGWRVETIFTDRDRGHWLTAAEFDGRNGTDELVGSGYGGRVFLLAREPGYGRDGLATDADDVGR